MRVTMDGSFLMLPPSGTGTYVRALTTALPTVDSSLDLRILMPPWEATETSASRLDRIRYDSRVRRARWELIGVARSSRRVHSDLLHIPHFSAPIGAGVPLIVTIHDVIPLVLPAYRASRAMRLHLTAVRRTVRAARLVLTPSRSAAVDVEQTLSISPERIRVTPEAAGREFCPADHPNAVQEAVRRLGVTERYVFNVGGLDVRKNLPVLLEAFARVRTRVNEPLQLVIAGARHSDNPVVFPPIDPVIDRLGLRDTVVFPGRVSEAEKLALYQGAAVYVTPSLYEGFGLTALEAMACGTPTIAANRTSLPEVIGDGGLLVEPDAEAFAVATAEVLTDPARASNLRDRGITRAAAFTWERTAQLTIDAYREVFESTHRTTERID